MAALHSRPAATSLRHRPKRALPPPPPRGAALADAVARFGEVLGRKQAQGDQAAVAACYLEIGDLYLSCGDSERAGEMYRRALQVSRGLGRSAALSV
jgi:hypothetical protein